MTNLRHIFTHVLATSPVLGLKLKMISISRALTVLNLHSVSDIRVSAYSSLRTGLFEDLLHWLSNNFNLITFSDLTRLESTDKPPLILSFDDGYKDFAVFVAPLLDRIGVRANVNIIPACVESGLPPLSVLMQDFIGQAPAALLREINFPGLPAGADPDRRPLSGQHASAALKFRPIAEQNEIFLDLNRQFARFEDFAPTRMMSLSDVLALSRTHEIGTHSFAHASMDAETDEYVAEDASRCRTWHLNHLGAVPTVYAFPNGSAAPRHLGIVRKAGYRHVLLVGDRFSKLHTHVHPRFTIHGNAAKELRLRAVGNVTLPFTFLATRSKEDAKAQFSSRS